MSTNGTENQHSVYVPSKAWRRWKLAAKRRGVSLSRMIFEMVEKALAET